MLCENPFMAGAVPFGCGGCLHCRINRARLWKWRQYLESLTHEHNSFVTLTYDRYHIPGNWSLERRALQLFFKSLRGAIRPHRIRYFAVGEYGSENYRPHYHISLFGLSGNNTIHGEPVAVYSWSSREGRFVTTDGIIHKCWGRGRVDVAEFNEMTAEYIAGHVIKYLVDKRNNRWSWNVPEFNVQSNRPGIGGPAAEVIAKSLEGPIVSEWVDDVSHRVAVGKQRVFLGRYLIRRVREASGFTEEYIGRVKRQLGEGRALEMHHLFENTKGIGSFKTAYLKSVESQLQGAKARHLIYKQRKHL